MIPQPPFVWLSPSGQKRAFPALLILTLAVMVGMSMLDAPLCTEVSPHGIVSFELAGDLSHARTIVGAWGETGRIYAGLSLGLDYLYLVAYASCIALGCAWVARGFLEWAPGLSAAGALLAWAQVGAALLDAVENYALIQVLLGSQQLIWPVLGRGCAIPKFLIVAAGLIYMVAGAAVVVIQRRHATRKN